MQYKFYIKSITFIIFMLSFHRILNMYKNISNIFMIKQMYYLFIFFLNYHVISLFRIQQFPFIFNVMHDINFCPSKFLSKEGILICHVEIFFIFYLNPLVHNKNLYPPWHKKQREIAKSQSRILVHNFFFFLLKYIC